MNAPLLELRNLTIRYRGGERQVTAVHDVSFALAPGGALAIVGESGSGKSSIAGAILDFLGPAAEITGSILFEGENLSALTPVRRRGILGRRIGAVFQDPFTSLNPALRVGRQIAEPMVHHLGLPLAPALRRAEIALQEMGIERVTEVARAFPHQLSGGMKQRALIAAALACQPPLLILDEPTTALDVTVESQILRLLSRLRRDKGTSLLFISHNLGVVRRLCDDVAVMYASQLVEFGDVRRVLERPAHPYSKGLLASRPPLAAATRGSRLAAIAGQLPTSADPDAGCVFAPRCPFHEPPCSAGSQFLTVAADGHRVRCWKADASGHWPRQQVAADLAPSFRRGDALVNVTRLSKTFDSTRGLTSWQLSLSRGRPVLYRNEKRLAAVNDVTFSISPGEVLGLVGESGCGKSTLGRLLLQLLRQSNGSVEFDGADLAHLPAGALSPFRKQAQIVFQNVGSSLNPRLSVGEALERPLSLFKLAKPDARAKRVDALLDMVRLPAYYRKRFPHQLSGGERQRVAIARALATEPRFIVCDEPVSALDVSVQATIVNLLADLRDAFGLSYLFISHDLAVVAQLSDRIAVMYRGRICEIGTAAEVLAPPHHPYTEMLLASATDDEPVSEPAAVTAPASAGSGCVFATRCQHKLGAVCDEMPPPLKTLTASHAIACHLELAPGAWMPGFTDADGERRQSGARDYQPGPAP
ncbi:MAG: ABC transporter ATP-binding protein [Alphaproteobacteria bacterium]|nr:ABC transporter ATP-binding protein [Alphaproteobacteria bacterium]